MCKKIVQTRMMNDEEEALTSLTSIPICVTEENEMDDYIYMNTGSGGWIFVVHNYMLYAYQKTITSPRFHHSSFIAGGNVQAAGLMMIENGYLTHLYAHSGHYRPTEKNIYQLLNYFISRHVDMSNVLVDAQRLVRICREKEGIVTTRLNVCA